MITVPDSEVVDEVPDDSEDSHRRAAGWRTAKVMVAARSSRAGTGS